MKKIYIQPETAIIQVATSTMIAESLPQSSAAGNGLNSNEILVKGQNNYSVWDDDWSN